ENISAPSVATRATARKVAISVDAASCFSPAGRKFVSIRQFYDNFDRLRARSLRRPPTDGIRQGTRRFSGGRRKARVQADGLRRAGRRRLARHRARRDDQARRKIRRPTSSRTAAAVSAYSAKFHARLFSSAESTQYLGYAVLIARQ